MAKTNIALTVELAEVCRDYRGKGLSYREIEKLTGIHRSRLKRVLTHGLGKQPGPLPLGDARARLEFQARVDLGLVPAPETPVRSDAMAPSRLAVSPKLAQLRTYTPRPGDEI